jgi:DNA-binding transcriptional ArsR family regulator
MGDPTTNGAGPSPYSDLEAERCFLGSLIVAPKQAVSAADHQSLSHRSFSLKDHALLYQSLEPAARQGVGCTWPDFVAHAEEVGIDLDRAALNAIFSAVGNDAGCDYYAVRIRDKQLVREQIKQAEDYIKRLAEPKGDPRTEISQFKSQIFLDSTQSSNGYRSATYDALKFSDMVITMREPLIGKWMREGDMGFVYGERGSGKTWFSYMLGCHLARGEALSGWDVPSPAPVLLIDGEMPRDSVKERVRGLGGNENFHILHHETLFEEAGCLLNLTSQKTQGEITALCVELKIRLLILDNLSCLFSGMKENEADEWEKVLPWFLDLRHRQIAVLIVHHSGVAGDRMRGTTKREDAAFWVIRVEELKDRSGNDHGAAFETIFTKDRNSPVKQWTKRWTVHTESGGSVSVGNEEISFDSRVFELIDSGLTSASDISQELGVAKSTVSKAAKRLEAKKLIELRGRGGYHVRGVLNTETKT